MQPALRTVPDDIVGTIARLFAYIGGLAFLALIAAGFFRMQAVIAAVEASPHPQWIEVERPHPAFELLLPELGGEASRYAIFRRDADGARKDVLTWGEPAGSGPYVMVEIYRPGPAGERFIDGASEIAARILDFTVTDDVKPAGALSGKFGPATLVDFAIAPNGRDRRCLGFARAFEAPPLQIAGWYCSAGDEVVERATLACALDRLTLISAAGGDAVAELFARAELQRSFCGQRNPILAATPEGRERVAASPTAALRGRIRPR
ncbi:MAG TPA: hypothetical protein VK430_08750 [Xanthobacteraceae bacterium]|nr:hypothetical protein [Xanthobacteraceae bacterium]